MQVAYEELRQMYGQKEAQLDQISKDFQDLQAQREVMLRDTEMMTSELHDLRKTKLNLMSQLDNKSSN